MHKDNKYSGKQRFSIKKYSFGVASALLGVFLVSGVAQTEEVRTTTSTSVETTEKAVPVIEKTNNVEAITIDNYKMSIFASRTPIEKTGTISKVEIAGMNKKIMFPDEVEVKEDRQNYQITRIDYAALKGATNVEEVVLPKKLETLDYDTLKDTKIKKIDLPETLKYIGTAALGSKTLEEVSMYSYTQTTSPFLGAENLKKITFLGKWDGPMGGTLTRGSGIKEIEIPEGVTNLAGALDDTANLKDIYLPSTFKGENDFNYTSIKLSAIDSKKEGLRIWVYENSEAHNILKKNLDDIKENNKKFNTNIPLFEIKLREDVPPTTKGA